MVPLLSVTTNEEPVNVWALLSDFLVAPVQTRCPEVGCNNPVQDGVLVPIPGIFTVVAMNRLDLSSNHSAPVFLTTKLSIAPPQDTGML